MVLYNFRPTQKISQSAGHTLLMGFIKLFIQICVTKSTSNIQVDVTQTSFIISFSLSFSFLVKFLAISVWLLPHSVGCQWLTVPLSSSLGPQHTTHQRTIFSKGFQTPLQYLIQRRYIWLGMSNVNEHIPFRKDVI